MKRKIWVLAALVLGLTTASRADFLLWLDAPAKRTNPNDPQVKTLTPGGGGAGTATVTPSATLPSTGTRTATPANSATTVSTFTVTPSMVSTLTNTPLPGSPTDTML